MKNKVVDTLYKNSWADLMARKALPIPVTVTHPTHDEQNKLMKAQGFNIQ
jgi:hypothetical protein